MPYKKEVSIIIVHYHVKKELFDCIQSIIDSKPTSTYEIIIVDNDEKKNIKKDLLKKFPKVIYVSNVNKGFGQGNNVGAQYAKGEYLFFLNPDTIVFKNALDVLVNFLKKNIRTGVVAPFLLHENKKPFEQGTNELTPLRAIFSLSFIHKMFPNNIIAKKYFIQWDKIVSKEVAVVPGTALMVSKKLFDTLKGFDEKFFLYFEEFDLCKRVKEKGLKLFIEPKAKIIHLWERSTKKRNDINKIFNESRFYYFKKHYGLLPALFTNMFLNFGKYTGIFLLIFLISACLLLYKISTYMNFIPDQVWFYLSARDLLTSSRIPLVGITSSHPWLHQGPFWTYLLSVTLLLGRFNPVWGAYLSILFSLLTLSMLYIVGSEMFSKRVGIIAALFYGVSPYFILVGRTPYHTTPIPFLTLILLYTIYKWFNGFQYGLPLSVFLLTLLFNFETATFMLTPIFVLLLIYGFVKKTVWIKDLYNPKLLGFCLIAWVIIMTPMLLYDIHNGYPQTVKFLLWTGYKIATVFGFPSLHPNIKGETFSSMFQFAGYYLRETFIFHNLLISLLLLVLSSLQILYSGLKEMFTKQNIQQYALLMLFFYLPLFIYLLEKTNSSAYFVVFFPTIALMFALFVNNILRNKFAYYPLIGLLIVMIGYNIYGLFSSNFLFYNNVTLAGQIAQSKYIINESNGQEYNLVGKGLKSNYHDLTLPYEYLTWWLGHGPSSSTQSLKFNVIGIKNGITIVKSVKK